VRAGHSLRQGGFSVAPYASFNLGDHVGDAPQAVAENRRLLQATLGARPVFLKQVHGWGVQALPCADGTVADACWAERPNTPEASAAKPACCIMVADCLPILISDAGGRVVGAAHAGWRGLCGPTEQGGPGVVEALLDQLRLRQPDADWLAWLGPCIGPDAFEVGSEVRAAFCAADPQARAHFRPREGLADKWWCDLPALARQRLNDRGVRHIWGNDGGPDWCTVSRPDLFFSHRRDRVSGRLAAAIFLE
jgi:YfiH family protein